MGEPAVIPKGEVIINVGFNDEATISLNCDTHQSDDSPSERAAI
jgi:hypothetical protein